MNRLLLCTLLLISCEQKSVKQELINEGVLDTISYEYTAYFSDQYGNNYNENYIVYKDYVLYQGKSDTKRLSPDMATFKGKGDGFAMDKNGIYYRGYFFPMDTTGFKIVGVKEIPLSEEDTPIWKTNKKVFLGTQPMEVAHPESFEVVDNYYTPCYYFKDKEFLYFCDKKIEGSNSQYVRLSGITYAVADKNHTYYKDKILTYKGEPVELLNAELFKTSRHVLILTMDVGGDDAPYWDEVPYMDAATLRKLSVDTLSGDYSGYLMDKNHVFFFEEALPIKKRDFDKIQTFGTYSYISDGKTIYHWSTATPYDVHTFGIVPERDGDLVYDKNGIYKDGEKLPFKYTTPPVWGKNAFLEGEKVIYEQQTYDISKRWQLMTNKPVNQ
ncbi:DKNYY domain-containing protein [Capnocytophaga gingivalis]|uniref:DKNYY domain-containing protein n=1 Tax=Capnocytophaga gingivalis TaxID=1017 RepID=A0ABU5Z9X5_9FLAO|nr:DKNYY domain-containing protein [Capnocytophaga gingivalis]MEB3075766.1 DKNYY domain-containing protein [Capnocytophaga gingivalis]